MCHIGNDKIDLLSNNTISKNFSADVKIIQTSAEQAKTRSIHASRQHSYIRKRVDSEQYTGFIFTSTCFKRILRIVVLVQVVLLLK